MAKLHITSLEQLAALCDEGQEVIARIETTRAAGQRSQVIVTTRDGRRGVRWLATKEVETGQPDRIEGDLTEQEWEWAACLNADWNRRLGLTPMTRWTTLDVLNAADRQTALPDFERLAANRPVVATTSDWRKPSYAPGETITLTSGAGAGKRQVYLVARIRFQPRDEINERDDDRWTVECVEPTDEECAVPFVRKAIERAAQQDADEQMRHEIRLRNANNNPFGL